VPRYLTNARQKLRRVNILPAGWGMQYAAVPFIGPMASLMRNGGARLSIPDRLLPHETPSAKRDPRRYAFPFVERKTRNVLSSWRPGQFRPRLHAAQPWLPTQRRMRTVRPIGGRKYEVLR